jgi:hypothetical protein
MGFFGQGSETAKPVNGAPRRINFRQFVQALRGVALDGLPLGAVAVGTVIVPQCRAGAAASGSGPQPPLTRYGLNSCTSRRPRLRNLLQRLELRCRTRMQGSLPAVGQPYPR